ncbi:hypothetical protein PIB30_028319 [Stylosanthes scabra]|uniref:Uncharacterized protein n=1 Tax=Stylosanthes scabra TaxID=79078 RepID=A0ABU6Z7Q8_9FABA|nr:hypothetical protein [Stylosanthes scabra]
MVDDDYDDLGFTPPSFDLGYFSQPLVVTASQGQPQQAEIHGKQPKMRTEATISQGQPQMAKIHRISDKKPIMKMEPKMSQDKDATPTPSHEDLLTPATLVALKKLHEETEKKLLSKQVETEKKLLYIQAEAKMSDILRMRAAIQAFDNLDTTAQDADNEEEPKTLRKRLYKFLFRFITGKLYEAVREHFMSLAREGEMDLSIMHIMCILHNRKNNDRFKDMIYCVPPYFMYHLLQKVHHKYFDPETNRPFALSILSENDGLERIFRQQPHVIRGVMTSYVSFCVERQDLAELPRYTWGWQWAQVGAGFGPTRPRPAPRKRVNVFDFVLLMSDGVLKGLGCPRSTLVFIAKRPVVISVKSEIRQNVRIIARRYNTSLDLSRPVKVET